MPAPEAPPRLTVRAVAGDVLPAPVVALAVAPGSDGADPAPLTVEVGRQLGLDVRAHLRRVAAKGEPGEIVAVPVGTGDDIVVVHLTGTGDGSAASLRKAGAALVRRAARDGTTLRVAFAPELGNEALRGLADGLLLGSYRYVSRADAATADVATADVATADGTPADGTLSDAATTAAALAAEAPAMGVAAGEGEDGEPARPRLEQVEIVLDDPDAAAPVLARATTVATATLLARDLVNEPSLTKTPAWLAGQAEGLAAAAGLTVRVRDEAELAAEGFGGICAVGMGSARPPRLIEVTYAPDGAQRHVVLVGKGITFDSGGLSLKTNEGMVSMKTDMAGGAAVLGVMSALAELEVPVRVTGLVAAAENMPGGRAQRPGDILTQYGGRTVEVLNTDAEGRLVLADALAYAVAELEPDAVVDLATLTGAASLGLGRRHGALYATDDALADGLLAAAADAGERLWRMPLVEDYRDALDSPVADLANIGRTYSGGSIVAALFLREFAGICPWAHLDIAGPARAEADEDEVTKGGTGYGVRLLLRWLAG